jgi:hypothetical protein
MNPNTERAVWTFLIYALAGPFFAACCAVILLALASALGFSAMLLRRRATARQGGAHASCGRRSGRVLTALVLAIVVLRTGALTWIVAAPVAVIAFAAAAVLLPAGLEDARPYLAFLAGWSPSPCARFGPGAHHPHVKGSAKRSRSRN